ncbi:GspE/PulE family protein [Brenneria izbisi]|uniref:Flp pilus assembly complex ATPase component TadA n=1 Tax=Brenneria izbisi TaxID=2939450 RepID=A0AA41Y258_9GAMM|nr:ATPase, T2SS/T4P/T4SS family [Brenneria izbisi]MCV9879282.1 Flp pilus assembly complex ATPase component TadA [Brenneria izbisi]MCV9883882.1 Flp pilus assembly complex ATPase component TadA [Brenneria izbisi]
MFQLDESIADFVLLENAAGGAVNVVIDTNRRADQRVQSWVTQFIQNNPRAQTEFVALSDLRERRRKNADESKGISLADLNNVSARQKEVLEYFEQGKAFHASDIHMIIDAELCRIQFRIHGELETVDEVTGNEGTAQASTIILSMCDVTETQFYPNRKQDGRVKAEFLRRVGLFGARYSHTPTASGLYVVMRIIPDDGDNVPSLDQLGLLPQQQQLSQQMLRTPEGIVLLTGPTGSGKSTTLRSFSAMYLERTRGRKRLLTIEDPPEGRIAGAIQTPIIADKSNADAVQQAWDNASSSALRLDPDAILMGEIRDDVSLKAALYASETGHLVLSTLHANSAVGSLRRMGLMGISEEMIADPQLLIGLISQRLVQVLCPHCRVPWEKKVPLLSPEQRERLERYCNVENVCQVENLYFRHEEGCSHCQKKLNDRIVSGGVVGRSVVAEVMRPDAQFMSLYLSKGQLAARQYWIDSLGGITRRTHLLHKLNTGQVDALDADLVCPLDEDQMLRLDRESTHA